MVYSQYIILYNKIVIGVESETALNVMEEVYRVLYISETPFIETNIEKAEMIKYSFFDFWLLKLYILMKLLICVKK